MDSESLWNTFILAARVDVLWEAGWKSFPDLMGLFEAFGQAVGTPMEKAVLDAIYEAMPSVDFSRDLLEHVPHDLAVIELNGILWSDWGNVDRILRTVRLLGMQPLFPLTQVAA